MVDGKRQARRDRKRDYELSRQEQANQAKAEDQHIVATAYAEYLRTRQPIGYKRIAGGRIPLYAEFVSPQSGDESLSES